MEVIQTKRKERGKSERQTCRVRRSIGRRGVLLGRECRKGGEGEGGVWSGQCPG